MTPEQARKAARWEKPSMFAALLVIPYLLIAFIFDGKYEVVANVLQTILWSFFLVEAVAMLKLAPNNLNWAKHNVLDVALLVVTIPIATFLPPSFAVFQVLWLLRILDLLPIVHKHFFRVTVLNFSFILLALTIFGAGMAFHTVEHAQNLTFIQSIYWASTTVSTVGYGDVLPHTNPGMVLAMVTQISGLVIAAIFVAGILPLFDKEFSEGFSDGTERLVREIAEDVDGIEDDMDTLRKGSESRDRVLAQILAEVRGLTPREKSGTMDTTTTSKD